MTLDQTSRGATDRLTLRFLDDELERRYQLQGGAESRNGYRLIALASAVIWAPAAFILPASTSLSPELAIPIGLAMSGLSAVFVLLARWATTLDRQHFLASVLTSLNGTLILGLAGLGGALPGYGVAAMLLLFSWGFVSRTRFIYAAARTAVIAVAFGFAVATYDGPANLALDVLFFAGGSVGILLALHIVELGRRRLYYQDLLIRQQADQLGVEIEKSDALIHDILPAAIATRLLGGERRIADDYPSVTVLFADLVGFTPLSARLAAREVIDVLRELFVAFDRLAAEHEVVKIKTIGDSYMAVGGLTPGDPDHPERVIRFAGDARGGRPARGARTTAPAADRGQRRAGRRRRDRHEAAGLRPVGQYGQRRQPAPGDRARGPRACRGAHDAPHPGPVRVRAGRREGASWPFSDGHVHRRGAAVRLALARPARNRFGSTAAAPSQPPPLRRIRSSSRRRRLLGRPSPRIALIPGAISRTTGGGLLSTKHVAATGAPTRCSIGRTTSRIRCRSAIRACTVSPARTLVDGFAGLPFTRTCPPSQSCVAIGRVFTSRTAHNQRSTRVSAAPAGSFTV